MLLVAMFEVRSYFYSTLALRNDISAEGIVTRSAARGSAVDDHAEATASTTPKRHTEDNGKVSKCV